MMVTENMVFFSKNHRLSYHLNMSRKVLSFIMRLCSRNILYEIFCTKYYVREDCKFTDILYPETIRDRKSSLEKS